VQTTNSNRRNGRKGQVVIMLALALVFMISLAGLAVDLVLAYAAKAQLTMAIDSVSLSTMRSLEAGSTYGEQSAEITRISNLMLKSNFPVGDLLAKSVSFSAAPKVYGAGIPVGIGGSFENDPNVSAGQRELRVIGEAKIPTMFMRVFGRSEMTVRSAAVAARQDVNVALVIDRSGSMAADMPATKAASKTFLNFFDNNADRVGVMSFATTGNVNYPVATGFKTGNVAANAIDTMNATGGTASGLGLWLAYAELMRVNDPNALNVIVFFSDGRPTAVPAVYNVRTVGRFGSGSPRCATPTVTAVSQAGGNPSADAISMNYMIYPGSGTEYGDAPGCQNLSGNWGGDVEDLYDPAAGLPTNWPALYNSAWGCSNCGSSSFSKTFQISSGPWAAWSQFESVMFSTSSSGSARGAKMDGSARNLAYSVAKTAHADTTLGQGVVIYTIGLGAANQADDFMLAVANDKDSAQYNASHPEGEYIYSPTTNELKAAFEKVRGHVIRLTR